MSNNSSLRENNDRNELDDQKAYPRHIEGGAIYKIMLKRGIVIPEYEEIMKEPGEGSRERGI